MKLKLKLQEFDYLLYTKKGKENGNSDGLSGMFSETEPEGTIVNALTGEAEEVGMIPESEGSGDTERKCRGEGESETACRYISGKEKLEISKEIHDSPIGGHAGLNRTYHKLKQFINWLGSVADILLILSCHLHLGLPSGLLHSGFPTKTQYPTLLSPYALHSPFHLILDFIIRKILGEKYRSLSSSLCSFPHSQVTSSS